jgi:hypothetical protein
MDCRAHSPRGDSVTGRVVNTGFCQRDFSQTNEHRFGLVQTLNDDILSTEHSFKQALGST